MNYEWGDRVSIPRGTRVAVGICDEEGQDIILHGEIVGKSDDTIVQCHIVKCTDGAIPNEIYDYECFSAPLSTIEVLDG